MFANARIARGWEYMVQKSIGAETATDAMAPTQTLLGAESPNPAPAKMILIDVTILVLAFRNA
jgi:hypothetical protein